MLSLKIFDRQIIHSDHLGLHKNFRELFSERLNDLLEKAPSDASLSTQISKLKKGYEGMIEIISSRTKFLANSIKNDPDELAFDLIDQIYKQILKWRDERILLLP